VWLQEDLVRTMWRRYCDGADDNSFFVWQWVTVGMLARRRRGGAGVAGVER
jgi:hypothetical protein